MRIRFFLGAFIIGVLGCTSAPSAGNHAVAPVITPSYEYAGVYTSTHDEDYFTPCGIDNVGDSWSLDFRDNEREAPFLKNVVAVRGYPPLVHFIRLRGRLGPPSRHNLGFQTRELAVDSVLSVSETLEPCAGYGVAPAWAKLSQHFPNTKETALSSDGSVAATMDGYGKISIWAAGQGGELLEKIPWDTNGEPRSIDRALMTFSDDGKLLAAGVGGIVRVWRVSDGKRLFSLALKDSAAVAKERAGIQQQPGYTQPLPPDSYKLIQHLVFNSGGTMLATTNTFSSIVWSMGTGAELAEFNRGNDFYGKLFFTADGGLLTTADSGRMVLRASLDAAPLFRAGTRARSTQHMVMSPDGQWIAVNGWGDTVFLWSVATQRSGPAVPVPSIGSGVIAFSPDGNTIATSGGANGLYLWDVRSGTPIKSFHNLPGSLSHAWFSPDGKSIVTFSMFDDRFRIVYIDPRARPAAENVVDDSSTARLPFGPPSNSPKTVGGVVTGPNKRAVADAVVEILNGDAPDSVVARTTTSYGGYFSFTGIRFRHALIRVHKPGFETGVRYIHVSLWGHEGASGIELTPVQGAGGVRGH